MSFGWITRILPGFVLAAIFFIMPLTELGRDEPWYFWVGSGVIALTVSTLLIWMATESNKGAKDSPETDDE